MNTLEALKSESKNNKTTHAYLFVGGSKEEQLEIVDFFCNSKGCLPEDISKIEPESAIGKAGEIKIEDIRALLHTTSLSPNGKSRLAVIFNCEKLNPSSGNILLKNLEEPPIHLTYLLFSRNRSVLPTIKSRCRIYDLNSELRGVTEHKSLKDLFGEGFFEASQKIDQTIKSEMVPEMILEIEKYLREKMVKRNDKKYATMLLSFLESAKTIDSNSSPRLVLECTYLKMKELE